jgi:hypothetical protein
MMHEHEAREPRIDPERWPMLGAFVETAVDDRLIVTFALSDVLPATQVEEVVLGVDALRDGRGHRLTLYAVFESQCVSVFTRCGEREELHAEAEVSYPDGAVTIVLDEPRVCLESQPDVTAFTVIDGLTCQSDAPVTLFAS